MCLVLPKGFTSEKSNPWVSDFAHGVLVRVTYIEKHEANYNMPRKMVNCSWWLQESRGLRNRKWKFGIYGYYGTDTWGETNNIVDGGATEAPA